MHSTYLKLVPQFAERANKAPEPTTTAVTIRAP
jgi:hypothetical protein